MAAEEFRGRREYSRKHARICEDYIPVRPRRLAKDMIASNSEQNSPILYSEPRPSIADRLVGLGSLVALIVAQMTWMGFLGWVALRFIP